MSKYFSCQVVCKQFEYHCQTEPKCQSKQTRHSGVKRHWMSIFSTKIENFIRRLFRIICIPNVIHFVWFSISHGEKKLNDDYKSTIHAHMHSFIVVCNGRAWISEKSQMLWKCGSIMNNKLKCFNKSSSFYSK